MPPTGQPLGTRFAPARLAAVLVIAVALVTTSGWVLHLPALTRILPGAVSMKINTALCLLSCALAVWFAAADDTRRSRCASQALGALVALVGAAVLSQYATGHDLGIDELLVKDDAGSYNVFRGRMSPYSSAVLITLGLCLVTRPYRALLRFTQMGAMLAVSVGAVSLLGYLWNAGELVTDRLLPPVAVHTAACFVLLGSAMLILSLPRQHRSNRSRLVGVELKIAGGFIAALTLLLAGGTFTYRTSVAFTDSVEWIAHTQQVRTTLADVFGTAAGADVAQRDFLLTRDPLRFDEYKRMTALLHGHLNELDRLIADNALQRQQAAALRALVLERSKVLTDGLMAYEVAGIPGARAVLSNGRNPQIMQDIRAVTDRMDAAEAALLEQRQVAAARVRASTLVSLLVTLIVATVLFIALFRAIHKEMVARRDAEDALRDSDQYNRSIIESSPDCVAVLTPRARILQVNPQGLKLLNVHSDARILGSDWCGFWAGRDYESALAAVQEAAAGRPGHFEGVTRTGISERWWDVIVMPVRGQDGKPERLLAVARDATDFKRVQDNLLGANRFLDSLIENLPVNVVVKDAKTLRFVRMNRAFEKLLGFSREEMVGKTGGELLPENAELIEDSDRAALQAGGLIEVIEQNVTTPLNGTRTVHTMKLPILHEDGHPEFLLALSVDITERKLAEQAIRALNDQLTAKAEQLQATNKELESFSYSVSHDLRAPLRAIDGFAEMLEEDYRSAFDAEGHRYLRVIRENSRRMGALIDDLLAFSRLGRQTVTRTPINVEALVHEVINEVQGAHAAQAEGSGAAPQFEVGTLPPTLGDHNLLRQVWVNLIANAVKYSSKSPAPLIRVSGRRDAAESVYTVQDNGVGFSMTYVQKLFGVFQRLHRNDEFSGTGVGLAIVHRVITRHGGRVWAEGKVNDGATFSFALPTGDSDGG
jgi:PAS domain S-box-containing protein